MANRSGPEEKTDAIEELERLGFCAKYVERPATESKVQRILRHAYREGLTVLPVGGGTALGLAPLPADLDIAVDMTGLAGVLAFNPLDLTLSVQAGMTVDAINGFLAEQGRGFFLPLDPPQSDRATLGGIYASKSCGPLRLLYGTLRDQALGIGAVDAQGRRLGFGGLTVKNVSGYDLTKFLMGSAGSLCAVTAISSRIHPLPEASSLCEIILQEEEALRDFLSGLWASVLIPSAVVVTDQLTAQGGVFRVLIAVEGHPKAVERQNRELLQLGESVDGHGEIHWGREGMVNRLLSATDSEDMHTLRLKVCVPMVQGPSAYSLIGQLAKEHAVETKMTLFAGNGVLYVYASEEDDVTLLELAKGVKEIAAARDGHVVPIKVPRGILSTWGPRIDPTVYQQVLRPIKTMLDPKGVFPSLT